MNAMHMPPFASGLDAAASSSTASGRGRQGAVVGILLVNLGSPAAPTVPSIRKFLAEFLADPRVVDLPRLLWLPLLKGVVLPFRPRRIREKYEAVWMPEGSPLIVWSQRQREAVERELEARGHRVAVALGMRYGEPSLQVALQQLVDQGCARILVLPLYPQYSTSTTATVIDRVQELAGKMGARVEFRHVERFFDDRGYIAATAHRVRDFWARSGRGDKLVMSFHGVPQRMIDRGDPYERECKASARLIAEALHLTSDQYVVTFQSRFGRAQWLQPDTQATVVELAQQGCKVVDVVCPGFVADCLETLEEIAMGCKAAFESAGGQSLRHVPALNADLAWIGALASLVEHNLLGWDTDSPSARRPSMTSTSTPVPASAGGTAATSGNASTETVQTTEEQLDAAIEDTFPASDPVSPDAGSRHIPIADPSREDSVEHGLDEALENTFPASDPISVSAPTPQDKEKNRGGQ